MLLFVVFTTMTASTVMAQAVPSPGVTLTFKGITDRKLEADIRTVFGKPEITAAADLRVQGAIRQALMLLNNAGYLEADYRDNRDTVRREIEFAPGPVYGWTVS